MSRIIGILNVTPDSFSDGGKFNSLDKALLHLQQMLEEGADMIDIGAESTRPTATAISDEEEWSRLEKILPAIIAAVKNFSKKTGRNIQTSIDSYHFTTIKKSYEAGIDIINDVFGLRDENIADFVASKNLTTVLMHNLPIEINPELVVNPDLNTTRDIITWGHRKIEDLTRKGIKKSQLIFDPGIGFNKNALQSIQILKNINEYRVLGLPLYVGHSKKSFLEAIKLPDENASRTEKTLVISKFLIAKKVDFLRVHDIQEHKSLMKK